MSLSLFLPDQVTYSTYCAFVSLGLVVCHLHCLFSRGVLGHGFSSLSLSLLSRALSPALLSADVCKIDYISCGHG